ncbi:MAG: hypothetical protein ABIG20_04395 [archaeon]
MSKCPKCGNALKLIPGTEQQYCALCNSYFTSEPEPEVTGQEPAPRLEPAQSKYAPDSREWLLKGWAIGNAYYNIYFDRNGMHAIRLDTMGLGRQMFAGFLQNAMNKDIRIHAQNKVKDKTYQQLVAEGYKTELDFTYDEIASIKVRGLTSKKLIVQGHARRYKFIGAYASSNPKQVLQSIPYLGGKVL